MTARRCIEDHSAPDELIAEVVKLRPPPWPKAIFGFDETLARRGETLFQAHCKTCHTSEQPSLIGVWSTLVPREAVPWRVTMHES